MKNILSIAVLPEGKIAPPPGSDCQVYLEGTHAKALTHIPGCYLFINLLPGEYKVVAEGENYGKKEVVVNMAPGNSWLVKLKPDIDVQSLV